MENINRGSEWRKWDLHIHTKGTNKNDQFKSSDFDFQFNQDDSSVYFVSDLNSCNTLCPKSAIHLNKAKQEFYLRLPKDIFDNLKIGLWFSKP